MKSDIDIKDDVYKVICASRIKSVVNGSICKRKRPKYSMGFPLLEDVCIAVIANNTSQAQTAYVNVNIYVQDDDVNGQSEEKSKRLRELCQLSFETFDGVHGNDFRLSMSEQRVNPSEGTGEHIINNKVLYQTIND